MLFFNRKTLLGLSLVSTFHIAEAKGLRLSAQGLAGITGARAAGEDTAQGVSVDRKLGYGASVMFETPLADNFSIGSGAMYLHRKFNLANDGLDLVRTIPTLVVPLEVRGWFGDYFSVAAGGFAAFRVGEQKNDITSGDDSLVSFSNDARKNIEYGLTGAVTVNAATINKTGIFAEARYNYGLSNASESAIFEERIDDFIFGVGARFELE